MKPPVSSGASSLSADVASLPTRDPAFDKVIFSPDLPSPPIAREGWGIIALVIVASAGLTWLSVWQFGPWGWAAGAPLALLVLFCLWFFRNPQRPIPADPHAVVAPADGVVIAVEPCTAPEELGLNSTQTGPMQRVVIFLNVFNVHVNRVPIAGTVVSVARREGGFAHAGKPEAMHNQRCSIAVQAKDGRFVALSQVTGLIARRIVCHAQPGEAYAKGQRYGLIRFGSRTDVYIPASALVLVKPGDKTLGGSTILARW